MASGKIKGITVEIGGDTTKLGEAIADSEKKTRSLQGELKQVERLLKMDPGNVELLAQKQDLLTQAVAETTKKLETLKDAEADVIAQFANGEIGEDQLRAFQREIVATEQKLEGFKSELSGTKDEVKEVGESAEKSGDGFTIMGGALADLVADVIRGAVSAIGDLIGSLLELSEATEEYRAMQAKLEGSSETFGYSMEFASEKYKEFYKYLGDDQMSTNAITNLMGIGAETETVSKLAEGATAVWASYGDSIPIESLTESINESITVGKVTGTLADSINWAKDANEGLNKALDGNVEAQKAYKDAIEEGLPVEDAFNEALAKITDSQERADVIAKFLNDTYGESKKAYDETADSILDANEAELKLKDTQAQLGETMAPVNTALTNLKTQALDAITPLVQTLAGAFMDLYTWLQANPAVMQALVAIAIALASAFTVLAGALAIQGIITGVTKAVAFLNTTLLANPITLIIALITGLVAGFLYLWNNCDAFRQFWINLWNNIKEVTGTIVRALGEFFTVMIPEFLNNVIKWFKSLPEKVRNGIASMVEKVQTVFTNVKDKAISLVTTTVSNVFNTASQIPGKIASAISGAISAVVTWGTNLASKGVEAGQKLLTSIINKAKEIPGKIVSIGADIVTGLWNGIGNKVQWLKDKIAGFVGDVTSWLKKFFGIKSPSRLMRDEIGRYLAEGIGAGITDNADSPIQALNDLGEEMLAQDLGLNEATINRKLSHTFNANTGAVMGVTNKDIVAKLDGIYERLGRLQMITDTGALVGEMIDKIDVGLGDIQALRLRGV